MALKEAGPTDPVHTEGAATDEGSTSFTRWWRPWKVTGGPPPDSSFTRVIASSREHPRSLVIPTPPPLDTLLTSAPSAAEIAAARGHGHTVAAIAAYLGCDKSTISRRLTRDATTET